MSDFLLELRCEEIPARMQAKARADLEKLFAAQLKEAGLEASSITTYSTPRRLALIARGLPDQTEAVSEERKGPAASAPEQALAGFLRSTGLKREDLVERDVKGKAVLFAVIEKPGQPTTDILARAIPSIIAAFPWPKSQRWGAASISSESLKWVRPLQGIIALFGDKVVDCDMHGIASGRETMGHRFHSEGAIEITSADDYADKLRSAHVIVDHEERQNIVREGAAKAASDAGLSLVEDEGLVIENAGLTEWPVPLLGRFNASFLDVPEEVIQLTTKINQKYFVIRDSSGKLTNAFVCTANIDAIDGGDAIVAGNEKVLAARLGDAKFFWELDQKTTLAVHGEKLSNIVFHEKLGTVADKVERVAKLARWLCEQGIVRNSLSLEGEGSANAQGEGAHSSAIKAPHPDLLPNGEKETLADLAEQAARLCKADLVTEMVGEFPELQGLMGGYYAAKEGLDPAVSNAIRDHYKPAGQSDDVPTDPVTVAVSLADKLDTLVGFFVIGEYPTGSKDPFALRRAALSILNLLQINHLRLGWFKVFPAAMAEIGYSMGGALASKQFDAFIKMLDESDLSIAAKIQIIESKSYESIFSSNSSQSDADSGIFDVALKAPQSLADFLTDRLKVQQKEAGVRHDLIDAVFALGNEDDLVRLLARVHALQSFVATEDGVNLLAGYKRASNILKKEGDHPTVIPAKAGIQHETSAGMDSRLRGNDESAQNDGSAQNSVRPEPVEGQGKAVPISTSSTRTAGEDIGNDKNAQNSVRPEPVEGQEEAVPISTSSTRTAGQTSAAPTDEPEQSIALQGVLSAAETKAAAAIESEDFEGAMSALASLRAPIDAFFDGVMVNDDNDDKKKFRLGLLSRFRDAVHTVADFSKIEG